MELFEEIQRQQLQDSVLRKHIHGKTQELEKFPKKSRHGQEWYEKYLSKYTELKAQHSNCLETFKSMGELIDNIEVLKEQALESMFHQLREAFRETFR